jgi:thiol-disulfide isomerase/thioredoxin
MGRRTTAVTTLALAALAAATWAQAPSPFAGKWRAVLASPGGDLPFTLRISARGDGLAAHAVNGAEQAAADTVRVDGRRILIRFDVYDSEIAAELQPDGRTLLGDWSKAGKRVLAFSAVAGDERRFLPASPTSESRDDGPALSGAWAATFGTGERAQAARGELQQQGERVSGTFLTPVGDHRYLEGEFRGGVLRLSRFDGSAASLYVARRQPDGSLAGQLFRGAGAPQDWTARRIEAAGADGLPDAFAAAGLSNSEGRLRFRFPDLQGQPVSLQDERFRGRVVLVNIFGSWCPNCNDEAPLLREWGQRYSGRGLAIVGLAYEQTGDPDGDRRAVQALREAPRPRAHVAARGRQRAQGRRRHASGPHRSVRVPDHDLRGPFGTRPEDPQRLRRPRHRRAPRAPGERAHADARGAARRANAGAHGGGAGA